MSAAVRTWHDVAEGRFALSTGVPIRNKLLAGLPPAELSGLRPHLIRVRMVNGQGLHEPGERIDNVFFFEQGMASMVAVTHDQSSGVEVGVIGHEGMVGLTVLLDPQATSFNRAMVQMPGIANRMSSAALLDCLGRMPVLRRKLMRQLEVYMAMVAQTAACNSRHSVTQRCARWLLLAHDVVDGDEVALTQEFLAIMLAVRRSGVTIALGSLREAGLVRNGRGRIMVADRPGLEAAACDCYARVQAFAATVAAREAVPVA